MLDKAAELARRMARPLTRAQQLQNAAFLRALRHGGNVREAARTVGIAYGTMQHRRSRHADFALRWDAALVFAQARLNAHGLRGPVAAAGGSRDKAQDLGEAPVVSDGSGEGLPDGQAVESRELRRSPRALRTAGGEPVIVRRNDGKLQMRRAQPNKLTQACEQAFLSALSATANVKLAAAAAGAAEGAFYRRKRRNAGFAREWRLALQEGYDRLELALLAAAQPEAFADDDWRRNDRPDLPPLTPNQALQLMYLHQKEARLSFMPFPERLRPGETQEARSTHLMLIHEAKLERDRLAYRIAQAERLAREPAGEGADGAGPASALPDLGQVTGWSKASGAPGVDDGRALFGGWRIEHLDVAKPRKG